MMINLSNFNKLTSEKLFVLKPLLSKSVFEITDGINCYAVLNGTRNSIETEGQKWQFKKDENWDGRYVKISILNARNENTGFLTFDERKNLTVEMKTGFKACLLKNSDWLALRSIYVWRNTIGGDIITLKESLWSSKKLLVITIENRAMKSTPELPLLILYGTAYSIMMRFHNTNFHIGV